MPTLKAVDALYRGVTRVNAVAWHLAHCSRTCGRLLAAAIALCFVGCSDRGTDSQLERSQHLSMLMDLDHKTAAGELVILGSSTVARWPDSVLPGAVRLGIPGDTVPGLAARMSGYRSLASARGVVIMIGFNDLKANCNVAAVNFNSLTKSLPRDVPIAWVGIQGVSPTARVEMCSGNMSQLTVDFNLRVEAVCSQIPVCRYVAHPVPAYVDGPTSRQLQTADGVHLTNEGYIELGKALIRAGEAFSTDRTTSTELPNYD